MGSVEPARAFLTLTDVLRCHSALRPHDRAYVFLSERGTEEAVLTFADLERRARAVAARLGELAGIGDRALLMFPAGLDFLVAFCGCLMAGVVAVPIMVPRRAGVHDASSAIIADCSPRLVLTSAGLADLRPDVMQRFRDAGLGCLVVDSTEAETTRRSLLPTPDRDDIAFLQYTSGSTSSPKGVAVSHRNLMANLDMIRLALGNERTSTHVSWVPLYHDMGLILTALEALYVGALCVLMAPASFIKRPLAWLRAIHTYRAEVSSAPNFAYDMCVERFRSDQVEGIDLSCWKAAINAAEPVRADTIERFASAFAPYGFDARAICPLYGLAEATVLVSGSRRENGAVKRAVSRDALRRNLVTAPSGDADRATVVGCGRAVVGERIAIVDADSGRRLAPYDIGEVWVAGPNVACGYWQNEEATAQVFRARIEGEGGEFWLRTGDLGFFDETGELFISGRIKDVIIIHGVNHYPQDIENTVQNSHPALRRHSGAAFTVADGNDVERLILVQEVERTARNTASIEEITRRIREAVFDEHEIGVHDVVLLQPGSVPKTTSGKIRRSLARKRWLDGSLDVLAAEPRVPAW